MKRGSLRFDVSAQMYRDGRSDFESFKVNVRFGHVPPCSMSKANRARCSEHSRFLQLDDS